MTFVIDRVMGKSYMICHDCQAVYTRKWQADDGVYCPKCQRTLERVIASQLDRASIMKILADLQERLDDEHRLKSSQDKTFAEFSTQFGREFAEKHANSNGLSRNIEAIEAEIAEIKNLLRQRQ